MKVLSEPELPTVCVNVISVSGLAGKWMKRYLLSFMVTPGNRASGRFLEGAAADEKVWAVQTTAAFLATLTFCQRLPPSLAFFICETGNNTGDTRSLQ